MLGNRRGGRGFTLVELVVVMVVIGILAVAAIPRLAQRNVFDSAGFFDQTQAALRYAQKTAIAQRRNVCVAIAAGTLTLTQSVVAGAGGACTVAVNNPSTGQAYVTPAPPGIALAASVTPFVFNGLGQLNVPASVTVTLTVAADPTLNRAITVDAQTGYVF